MTTPKGPSNSYSASIIGLGEAILSNLLEDWSKDIPYLQAERPRLQKHMRQKLATEFSSGYFPRNRAELQSKIRDFVTPAIVVIVLIKALPLNQKAKIVMERLMTKLQKKLRPAPQQFQRLGKLLNMVKADCKK